MENKMIKVNAVIAGVTVPVDVELEEIVRAVKEQLPGEDYVVLTHEELVAEEQRCVNEALADKSAEQMAACNAYYSDLENLLGIIADVYDDSDLSPAIKARDIGTADIDWEKVMDYIDEEDFIFNLAKDFADGTEPSSSWFEIRDRLLSIINSAIEAVTPKEKFFEVTVTVTRTYSKTVYVKAEDVSSAESAASDWAENDPESVIEDDDYDRWDDEISVDGYELDEDWTPGYSDFTLDSDGCEM